MMLNILFILSLIYDVFIVHVDPESQNIAVIFYFRNCFVRGNKALAQPDVLFTVVNY